jgi:hypothetical protein
LQQLRLGDGKFILLVDRLPPSVMSCCQYVQDEEEVADPLLLKTRKKTEEVVKTLSTAYEQSEYATAARTRIFQILYESVSLSIFKQT